MRHELLNKKALTLTELLVSSFLMGIVMVGIAGFSVSIKRMQDTTDKQAILAMQMHSAIAHMVRNFTMAAGDVNDPGIDFGTSVKSGPARDYWSVRQDVANTPDDYTDDIWRIYVHRTSGSAAQQAEIRTCTQPAGTGAQEGPDPAWTGGGACNQPNALRVLQKMSSVSVAWVKDPSPSSLNAYFQISIDGLYDPSSTIDPINNPGYTVSTRIATPSMSCQYNDCPGP